MYNSSSCARRCEDTRAYDQGSVKVGEREGRSPRNSLFRPSQRGRVPSGCRAGTGGTMILGEAPRGYPASPNPSVKNFDGALAYGCCLGNKTLK